MKKIFILLILTIMSAIALTACGSQQSNYLADRALSEIGAVRNEVSQSDSYASKVEKINIDGTLADNKKITKNAAIDIEVTGAKDTYNKILDWAKSNGGYEFSQNLNARGGYNVIDAKIKIPPQRLDDFIIFIDGCGDVINCNVSANDITAEYFDSDVRLKSLRVSLDSYYKMLESAQNVDEILKIQKVIDEITAQIESTQGKLNLWDSQINEATVTLGIHEKSDPIKTGKQINFRALSASDMGWLMKNGFLSVWNFAVTAIQWIIIIIISIFPLLVIAAIIIVIILFLRKKRKK